MMPATIVLKNNKIYFINQPFLEKGKLRGKEGLKMFAQAWAAARVTGMTFWCPRDEQIMNSYLPDEVIEGVEYLVEVPDYTIVDFKFHFNAEANPRETPTVRLLLPGDERDSS